MKEEIDEKDFGIACIELNVILCNLPNNLRSKIPIKILNEIGRYKSNKYIYRYDYTKPLIEQKMKPLTQELLYYIYIKYLKIENLSNEIYDIEFCKDFDYSKLFEKRHIKKRSKIFTND